MSEQKKFNIGDRVRVKNPEWELRFDCGNDIGVITSEDIGKVKRESFYGEDFVEVAFCDGWVRDDFTEDELELVESYDRKTDFLTRLSELMREFDVELSASAIGSYCGDDIERVSLHILIDGSSLSYDMTDDDASVTPSNIMNYEKE